MCVVVAGVRFGLVILELETRGHTITHRILQKSTGKAIGSTRIFPQYSKQVEDLDIKLVHCDKISDNNNEVVKILNEDLNMSVCEDDDVDFEDMIIESMKDLRRSEDVNGISSDEDDDDIDVHKTINNSCDTSSELDETTKSDSSTKSRAATLKSTRTNKSHGRGETSKSTSSAHTSASSQRVTLKSFYQKLEDDSPDRRWERVKCKLCALVGIEKIIVLKNFSHHVKNIHEAREKEKCAQCGKMVSRSYIKGHMKYVHGDEKTRRGSCEHCGKLITKKNLSTHRKLCAQKNKELEEDN